MLQRGFRHLMRRSSGAIVDCGIPSSSCPSRSILPRTRNALLVNRRALSSITPSWTTKETHDVEHTTSFFTQSDERTGLPSAWFLLGIGAAAAVHSASERKSLVKCEDVPTDAKFWTGTPDQQPAFNRSWQKEKVDKAYRPKDDFVVIAGNANIDLAQRIATHLGVQLSPVTLGRFTDGETKLHIHHSCRGKDIFILQPTHPPVNENLVDLLIMISTCRRASAKRITAVIPYYGYGRADRKNASRIPITAADVAKLLESMGVDRVVAVDLHCGAIQGFFPPQIPMDNLSAMCLGEEYFVEHHKITKCVVVSPDAGGVYRARKFQEGMIKRGSMDVRLAMLVKQRSNPSEIARMDLVGDVAGQDVILVDDMVDTAGTLCEAAKILKGEGARRIFAFATHGVLSGPALKRISDSELEELVVTDSVAAKDGRDDVKKIKIISVGVLVADGLRRIYQKESLSWDALQEESDRRGGKDPKRKKSFRKTGMVVE